MNENASKLKVANPEFDVRQIEVSEDDKHAINEQINKADNYFLSWKVETWDDCGPQMHFPKGGMITFRINCAASRLLVSLQDKVDMQVEIATFDLRRLQPSKIYSFSKRQGALYPYFQISYGMVAESKGLFGFNAMITNPEIELFHVFNGNYFQVG